uniref:cGMP-dependent protein kinase n=1 Tax=Chromulina nebulosa TaxID=96789 RepID=A0A7S0SWA7_9STRA|mmetsp:Transcript_4669/g.4180  ORF Transcript_4669/g.4180 Transcript_4669/m.4180 type:complete len:769 (+) Transcript_4669:73-2379(+)
MGSGASFENGEKSQRKVSNVSNEISTHTPINNRNLKLRKNQQIFENTLADDNIDDILKKQNNDVDEPTFKLLSTALSGFFFLQSDNEETTHSNKLQMLIRGMQREEVKEGYLLIIEGESGSKLYVVQEGELQVSINGEVIRQMGKGTMLGELALLYDAPRSATVKCITDCVLWTLRRDIFKRIQAISSTTHELERSRGLINSPDLAVLSAIDLSRLVGSLQPRHNFSNEKIYTENSLTNQILLIERGTASVYTTKDLTNCSKEEIDKSLCIFRPRNMSDNITTRPPEKFRSGSISVDISLGTYVCDVGPGCLLGIAALRSKAGFIDGWKWVNNNSSMKSPSKRQLISGAECQFTVIANDNVYYHYFTVEAFENLFGSINHILKPNHNNKLIRSSSSSTTAQSSNNNTNTNNIKSDNKSNNKENREIKFDSIKFKMKCILGTGSFGVVLMGEYKPDKDSKSQIYALKCLSKVAVVETGQLRHVLDERKILALMDSQFVLKLYGVYQTPHQLVMVTEALEYGDLWGIIYETPPYCDNGGLDKQLTTFYTASLVLALDHIHRAGVVYRDLKPENIMLDSKGYIRVIDFGFAKKVPYSKIDANGEEKVFSKTYTLCGTPEYLSPELIFNLGHDQASDLWALGVLVHEMFLGVTPFVPKRADNVTELFTNIALVKKNGLQLSPQLDERAGNPDARSLISLLLAPEPSERYGVQGGFPRSILTNPFFNKLNIDSLEKGTLVPDFIPQIMLDRDPISSSVQVKPFNGDQKLFADF